MNFKIIETLEKYPDVLLYRDRDEHGGETVVIMAIGFAESSEDYSVSETVCFNEPESAKRFIADYSDFSANIWCQTQNVFQSEKEYLNNN